MNTRKKQKLLIAKQYNHRIFDAWMAKMPADFPVNYWISSGFIQYFIYCWIDNFPNLW